MTLLPCPSCGELPEVTRHFRYDALWTLIHRCKIMPAVSIDFTGLENIYAMWNPRATVAQFAAQMDAMTRPEREEFFAKLKHEYVLRTDKP